MLILCVCAGFYCERAGYFIKHLMLGAAVKSIGDVCVCVCVLLLCVCVCVMSVCVCRECVLSPLLKPNSVF